MKVVTGGEIGKLDKSPPQIRNSEISNWTPIAEPNVPFRPPVAADPKRAAEIHQRLINFGARTTRVAKMLPKTAEGRYISQQLLRCGLAAASNYAEARAAESRADFVHKLRIVLKELNESRSWLEQIVANSLFSRDKMDQIIAET